MKNLLLGIIAINLTFISADTNAFEFMGIKPGMTYKEVEKIASARKQQKWPLGLSADFHYPSFQMKKSDFSHSDFSSC